MAKLTQTKPTSAKTSPDRAQPAKSGPKAARDGGKSSSQILQKISKLAKPNAKIETYRSIFRSIAEHFDASFGQIFVRKGASVFQDDYVGENRVPDELLAVADAMLIEAEADARANVRLFAQTEAPTIAVLSAPIHAGSDQVGTLCLATRVKANKDARILLSELIAILAFAGSQLGTGGTSAKNNNASKTLEKVLKYNSVTEFAYSLVNTLASRYGCEQVAFGLMGNSQAKVLAISGLDRFSRSSHGVVAIQQAMEECSDAREPIDYLSKGADGYSTGGRSFLLHRQWHRAANNASLLSVPLLVEDQPAFAVISMMREASRPFTAEETDSIVSLLSPLAPAVSLLERSSRSTWTRTKDNFKQAKQFLLKPGRIGRKCLFGAFMVGLLYFFLGWLPHNLVVPCHVEPASTNYLAMPYAGTLQKVFVSDGQAVKQGDLLAVLDARPLKLERDRLITEIASYQIQIDQSLSNGTVSEAAVSAASLDAAQLQLQIVEDRLSKSQIIAPSDGVVLRGELDQRLGQLLQYGDPLMEIGTVEQMRVRLDVPERMAHFVEIGHSGKFSSFARPGKRIPFEVSEIAGRASVENEVNVFVAEGQLASAPEWMRAGMEGTARVNAGWQPTWWVLMHGLVDRIRMAFWL